MVLTEDDIDALRRQFAERLEAVIGDKRDPANLQNFHEKTGRPIPKLIQWRNPKHRNWPDVTSLLQMCSGADISPTWLLFGRGEKNLSHVPAVGMDKHDIIDQIVRLLSEFGETDRRKIKNSIVTTTKQIMEIFSVEDGDSENVSSVDGSSVRKHTDRTISLDSGTGAQGRRRRKGGA